MFFYNDECELVEDDQYDLFTSTTILQRHSAPPGQASAERLPNRQRTPLQQPGGNTNRA